MNRLTGRSGPRRANTSRAKAAGRRDPFDVLGLNGDTDLTDDEVRAAWRRIAAATHPDRADGGDPDGFAAAAAAYSELRTSFGRAEARARAAGRMSPPAAQDTGRHRGYLGVSMIRNGRPRRLVLRLALAAAAATAAVLAAGPSTPAAPALATGALTWFVLTARDDLGPP